MRLTIKKMVEEDLGYCCEWYFWWLYRQNRYTPIIATRLGVSPQAVRRHKNAYRRGKLKCEECTDCCLSARNLLIRGDSRS